MKDLNLVQLAGIIFWSKLDDKQSYSILRVGVKLPNGASVFCTVNNPSTKQYDILKAGNKVLITGGVLDTWEKTDGTSEMQIKANDPVVQFFSKESVLPDINKVITIGKVLSYEGDMAVIEMTGERNPKTDQPTKRKAKIKIGDTHGTIVDSKIMLEGKVTSVDVDGKSKMVIEADYDKILIL